MPNFLGKNLDEVRATVMQRAEQVLGRVSFKAGGRVRSLLEVFAQIIHALKTADQERLLDQSLYVTASGLELERHAAAFGLLRRGERKASGTLQATASSAGTLRAGAWIVVDDFPELRWRVREDVAYSVSGTISIPVEAEFAGPDYNILTGARLSFSSVNNDLKLQPSSESFPESAGLAPEGDQLLRQRIAARFQASYSQDLRGAVYEDFIYTNFSQVRDVRVVRTPRGAGSVDIYIKTAAGLPDQSLLGDIRDLLGANALLARSVQILAPVPQLLDIEATCASAAQAKDIQQALERFIDAKGIGAGLSMQELYQVTRAYEGVEFQAPLAGLEIATNRLLQIGTIRIEAAP